jgi:formylglycine-generating enzyme required for sulfatase activity
MPLRLGEEDQQLQGAMEMALVKGLQQKYEVFFGEQVAKKAREIFMKESKNTAHKECDEMRCLQGIAEAFQAELLATANITKQNGGYFIALSVQNLFDNKVVQSESIACKSCDAFAVVDKLKELVGTPAPVAIAPVEEAPSAKVNLSDPETALWGEAKKGNAAEDYQAYLSTYPKGKYAPLAKLKLARMKDEAKAVEQQQEQQAWSDAQQIASQENYSAYLRLYPKGRFAALAQARIAKLKREETGAEVKQRREQLAEEARQKSNAVEVAKQAGQGPVMVRIPGKSYELGKYEVTQKEWQSVMGNNPSGFTSCGDNCPVEKVSWDDIQVFLQKLNAKTGRQYRLPMEVEWEYACYGGSITEYCGSNDIDSVAWYGGSGEATTGGNSNQTTHPVGQKQANGYGLYDMSGNVWEWMQDDFNGGRALRGGSWSYFPEVVRAADRGWRTAAFRLSHIGFRLARTLP